MKELITRFRMMPEGLALLSILCSFSGLLIGIVTLLPTSKKVNNVQVTFEEFWLSGQGMFGLILAGFLLTYGFALYKARRWTRMVMPGVFTFGTLMLFFKPDPGMLYQWIIAAVFTLFWYWYFYRKPSVNYFFSSVR